MKTRAFDGLGAVLSYITLTQAATVNLTAPETGSLLAAYDAGPTGTVFMPPVTVSITYPEGKTPGGGDYIAWWNGTAWIKLPSAVNSANGTIAATVSHFTRFALISLGGAAPTAATGLTLSDLTLTPTEVTPNAVVTVTVTADNPAVTTASEDIVLKLDGEVLASVKLTLQGGASQMLTFTLARPEAGTYQVAVNDLNAELTVKVK